MTVKLPKGILPRPIVEAGETYATDAGWVCKHTRDGSIEILVESKGLFTKFQEAGLNKYGEPQDNDTVYTREYLESLDEEALLEIAEKNEIDGSSAEEIVDALVELFGL